MCKFARYFYCDYKKGPCRLTWDPSGCCQWRASGPGCPRVAGQGRTCCRETPLKSSTATCGKYPCNWRPDRTHSRLWETSLWHSDFLFAARVRSQHQGRTGLWQESRDKTRSSGPAHRTGSLGLGTGTMRGQ